MSFNEQENGKMSAAGKSGTIWGGGGILDDYLLFSFLAAECFR